MPNAPSPDDDALRATPLDVVVLLAFSACWSAMLGFLVITCAASISAQLRTGAVSNVLAQTAVLAAVIGFAAYLTAYFLAGFIFAVTLDGTTIIYRDTLARRVVKAEEIADICFLDGAKGRRYIIIRAGKVVHGVSNMLWSTKDFSRLCDRLQAWRSAGGFSFPITSDNTYGHETTREFWLGSRKLPYEYRRYMPLAVSMWAGIALIVGVMAFLHG